jgi:ribosomal protein L37AE/L43A
MSKRILENKPQQPGASLSDLATDQQTHQQGKQCPKCSYTRMPSDTAPEWQCPHCKIAYYKVSAEYEADRLQKAKSYARQRVAEVQARRKRRRNSDISGFIMLMGLILAAGGLGSACNCGGCLAPATQPNLWLIGSGLAAMAGGFISWLGNQVSRLHNHDRHSKES